MSYRDIPDTELAEDKFLAASTLRDLRDNIKALSVGDGIQVQMAALANGAVTANKLATGTGERDWVLARTAAADVGAIGTYALMRLSTVTSAGPGEIHPGSSLRYSSGDAAGATPNTAPGSWRCMGYIQNDRDQATLWLRVS